MKLFKNKYKTDSIRLKSWDYGNNGYYFITICTKNRLNFFGEIVEEQMILNSVGKLTEDIWKEIPNQFDYVQLDEFIIMPNHVHGIIMIQNDIGRDAINGISTSTTSTEKGGFAKQKNPMLNENISRIIRWYKGRTTFDSRKENADFGWQSLFWDHIIRDERALSNIRNYIKNNPNNWMKDKSNTMGLGM